MKKEKLYVLETMPVTQAIIHLEGEERQCDGYGRHLVGIVELADKEGIGEVVEDIYQHAEHAGQKRVSGGP